MILFVCFCFLKDTCTGFLLGGIGEINAKRQKNFLVVTKGKKNNNLRMSSFINDIEKLIQGFTIFLLMVDLGD